MQRIEIVDASGEKWHPRLGVGAIHRTCDTQGISLLHLQTRQIPVAAITELLYQSCRWEMRERKRDLDRDDFLDLFDLGILAEAGPLMMAAVMDQFPSVKGGGDGKGAAPFDPGTAKTS